MTLVRYGMIGWLGTSMALAGCGYSCEDFCKDSADCPGSGTNPDDCDASCELIDRVNEDFSCDDEFDEMLSCADDLDDLCDDDEAVQCSDEALDWAECVNDYCTAHPSNNDCG